LLWPDIRKAPPLIVYCYLSHRFLKWMTPFSLLIGGLLLAGALACWIGALATVGLIGALALLLLLGAAINLPYCRLALTALASLAGVALGQLQALLTSEKYVTWDPADSVRR
jgi:hypothetical protein